MSLRNSKKYILIFSFLLVSACTSSPPPKPENNQAGSYDYVIEYMDWYIKNKMDEEDIVGLSVALVDDQKVVWKKGFGYADKENEIKATPDTRYRAGSISKVFTAMAVMKLVEQGKMDIDAPLVTYLPAFSIKSRFGSTEGITPGTIMTHHSGLPENLIDGMWVKEPVYFDYVLDEIKDDYVCYRPNEILSYSNLGFTLLGLSVEKLSTQEYSDFLEEILLEPLVMKSSGFAAGLSGVMSSKSYSDGEAVYEQPLRDIPAGGLNTTVSDLARLAMMINNDGYISNKKILSAESIDRMFTVQNSDVPLDLGEQIGLSWFISNDILNDELVYGHGGTTIAHNSSFFVAPESKLAVVVLANSDSADAIGISEKLLQLAWQAKTGKKYIEPQLPVIEKELNFSGTYSTPIGKVGIEGVSSETFKVVTDIGSFKLYKRQDGRYKLKYLLFGFIPLSFEDLDEVGFSLETVDGHELIVVDVDHHRFLAGEKVLATPIASGWKQRLGNYELLNQIEPEGYQIDNLELKIEDGFLVAHISMANSDDASFILKTLNSTEAILAGMGRGFNETIRVAHDESNTEILMYSGLRFLRKAD